MEKIELLMKRIDKFNKDRDWDKFHSPSNLAKSISIEANELLECFQWNDNEYDIEAVKEELADVMNYCLQMSMVLGLDIIEMMKIFIKEDPNPENSFSRSLALLILKYRPNHSKSELEYIKVFERIMKKAITME